MSEAIISIKNLHKYFGDNEVLKGIDLEIQQGEVVVIIGLVLRWFFLLPYYILIRGKYNI